MVTKRTTMLHPFCSQVTTLQHFKTGFRVERERFLPTHLIGCSADFLVLTKHLLRCFYMVKSCSLWVMTASKLATALSFHYNHQNYCRADGPLGLFNHISYYISTSAGDRLLPPPGNSHIPEVQIKPGRFFLTVEEESLTSYREHNAHLLGMLSPL